MQRRCAILRPRACGLIAQTTSATRSAASIATSPQEPSARSLSESVIANGVPRCEDHCSAACPAHELNCMVSEKRDGNVHPTLDLGVLACSKDSPLVVSSPRPQRDRPVAQDRHSRRPRKRGHRVALGVVLQVSACNVIATVSTNNRTPSTALRTAELDMSQLTTRLSAKGPVRSSRFARRALRWLRSRRRGSEQSLQVRVARQAPACVANRRRESRALTTLEAVDAADCAATRPA